MGTPGHMAHPFDVDDIKTGQDLIDYINIAVTRLSAGEIAGSVKWDGINTSIKLITKDNGEKEFRMDRGTSEIDSVVGFDAKAAFKKWGRQHGMPHAIATVLKIFNRAIPQIKDELTTLGLWDDPTKYFNTEYIEGKSNVHEYGSNILAIHGINQFYEKKAQSWRVQAGKSMDRPGRPRPLGSDGKPIKAGGIEISYSHTALENLIRKVKPIAHKHEFEIYGDVSVQFDPEMELDLEAVLDISIEIQIEEGNFKRASLREWLQMAEHPKDKRITRADGKDMGALSKEVYLAVLRSATDQGKPLNEFLKDATDINDAINGGIFYHATRLLGQAVKDVLVSEAGSLSHHEGVVLRGMEDFLVKFTGDFIVQGLESSHGQHVSENLSQSFTVVISEDRKITKSLQDWLNEAAAANHKFEKLPDMVYKDILSGIPIVGIVLKENAEKAIYNTVMSYVNGLQEDEELDIDFIDDETEDPVVDVLADDPMTYAIVPGAYKPPHAGHADMVKRYATGLGVEKADKVYVVISSPMEAGRMLRDGTVINEEHAIELWKKLFPDVAGLGNVEFEVAPSEMRSPITVAYEYISERSPLPLREGDKVILGASDKSDKRGNPDWMRWAGVDKEKHVKEGVELLSGEEYAVPALSRGSGW